MGRAPFFAVAILVALAAPALAERGSFFEERIQRLVASPTPVGPASLVGDAFVWEVVFDGQTDLLVEASAPQNSPFYLTSTCSPGLVTAPSTHDARTCGHAGTWRIQVDPAAGVAVDIRVRFSAFHEFSLEHVSGTPGCVTPGVCLP